MEMRPVRALLVYLLLVFVLGALLAPCLFWVVQYLAQHFSGFSHMAANPFHRFVNRSLLGVAVIGLWPFMRALGIGSWESVGFKRTPSTSRELILGFSWGFASLALVALIAFGFGARKINPNLTALLLVWGLLKALASATVVAILEELLFRGALLGSLRRIHPWLMALLVSSALYAIVHFFQRPQSPTDIHWFSGFEILGRMLHGFAEPEILFPGFLTLTVAGAILGLAFLQTGLLYRSIGLHAGWIFWLKFYSLLSVEQPLSAKHRLFWGSGKLFDSMLALTILLPVLAVFWRNYVRSHDSSMAKRSEKLA
ncbi:MAG: prenyl protease-like protein [Verrucomicrobiales bacterium]|nr:prenyl protease-like protein [Verrucomicrobiales bacterium]